MPLRLDNARALPTCPQQQTKKTFKPRFKVDHAASPMPETRQPERLAPRATSKSEWWARSSRNPGRDQNRYTRARSSESAPKASRWLKASMFRLGGIATTATIGIATTDTIGTAGGTTPTRPWASAQVVSPSARDNAAGWRLPRLNGTTAAGSRARSAAATKRRATKK